MFGLSLTYGDLLAHFAMLLFCISYLFRDIFWLRFFSIIGSTAEIAFFYLVPEEPIWVYIFWNGVFVTLNAGHLILLARERVTRPLTEEESELSETIFRGMTRFEFLKLLRLAHWRSVPPATCLTVQGERVAELLLIFDGTVDILKGDEKVAEVKAGQFIGEMSFASGEPATATVRSATPLRYICWSQEDLRSLLQRNRDLQMAMEQVLSKDVVNKLSKSFSPA
ncbi:MAG: cyclic nucleotide-binding domain-containing protein [Pseudomonadota bacterium]